MLGSALHGLGWKRHVLDRNGDIWNRKGRGLDRIADTRGRKRHARNRNAHQRDRNADPWSRKADVRGMEKGTWDSMGHTLYMWFGVVAIYTGVKRGFIRLFLMLKDTDQNCKFLIFRVLCMGIEISLKNPGIQMGKG